MSRRLPFTDESGLEAVLDRLLEAASNGGFLLALALLGAAGVGALHALGPGHGKTLVGAYLLGDRGQARDAVALGVLVATMHTVTVLVLGVVLLGAVELDLVGAERGLRLVAASAVTLLGLVLLVRRLRGRARSTNDGGHTHPHPPDGVAPRSRAGIIAIASTGGLVPSPAAVAVLLAAVALGRPALGVGLVAAFGLGLAATLAGLGLLVRTGRGAIDRAARTSPVAQRVRKALPVVSAVGVTLAGLVLLAWTLAA
jgi:ABC-type nickel/cobalt efflux system permease component RcnA